MRKDIEWKIKADLAESAKKKIDMLSNPKTELLIGKLGEDADNDNKPVYGLFMSDPDTSTDKEVNVHILQEIDLALLREHFQCTDEDLLK